MNEMKTLPLAFTYVGVFLGAGFVSGPELWQFFGAFGNWGYVGFLLAAVLFTLFGILLVRLTQVAHTDEMDRLLVPWNIPWLRAASGIVAAAFLFGVVVIMAAGSGALLEQMTGLPTWIGNALFMLAVALVALLGVTGMVSAFSALIPVLVLATLAFAAAACIKFGTENIFRLENVNTNPLMPTWLVASLTFVAYNLLGGIGIMAPIGKLVKKRSAIYWGITLAGLMLTVVAASILFSMAVYPAAIEAELPMVAVATAISPMLGTVYGIVLLLSMFCNALASLVAMLTYMEQKLGIHGQEMADYLKALEPEEWHNEQEKIRQLMPYKLPAKLVEYLKTGPLRLEFPDQEWVKWAELYSFMDVQEMTWKRKKLLSLMVQMDNYSDYLLLWSPRDKKLWYLDIEHEEFHPLAKWDDFIADPGRYLNGMIEGEFEE